MKEKEREETMKKLVFATGNEKKMKEIRSILRECPYEVLSMKEVGIDMDIVEDGTTFEENALIKARAVFSALEGIEVVLADDSGLEIDYLDKAPGIYSARFMGEDTPYSVKNKALIEKLDGVEEKDRSARFRCVIAAVFASGKECTVSGSLEGEIAYEEKGENGFGYDPIFWLPERNCTTAQLSEDEKNEISHRGKALRGMVEILMESEQDESISSK